MKFYICPVNTKLLPTAKAENAKRKRLRLGAEVAFHIRSNTSAQVRVILIGVVERLNTLDSQCSLRMHIQNAIEMDGHQSAKNKIR